MEPNKDNDFFSYGPPESREDAQARAAPYPYPTPSYPYYRQDFMPNYCGYGMQMMAPQPARLVQNTSDLHAPPVSTQDTSISQKKKNRWSDTEERILIELFGDNERKLRYKAFNSPEWKSIATQLKEKCKHENVACDKTAQQCKNKMANLTKKYKNAKDKLRSMGYGKGGEDLSDQESQVKEHEGELFPRHYNDLVLRAAISSKIIRLRLHFFKCCNSQRWRNLNDSDCCSRKIK